MKKGAIKSLESQTASQSSTTRTGNSKMNSLIQEDCGVDTEDETGGAGSSGDDCCSNKSNNNANNNKIDPNSIINIQNCMLVYFLKLKFNFNFLIS